MKLLPIVAGIVAAGLLFFLISKFGIFLLLIFVFCAIVVWFLTGLTLALLKEGT